MASLELPRSQIVFGNYMPMHEPESLEEILSQFEGEVNNEVTRQRIIFALDEWNVRNGTNITIDDLELN